jgi:hypothetical protein
VCYTVPMRGQITPAKIDKDKLREWYVQGVTVTEIGKRFGCSQQRVCQVARKLGLTRAPIRNRGTCAQ